MLALQGDGGGAAELQHRRPRDAAVGEKELARLRPQHLLAGAHLAAASKLTPFRLAHEVGAQAQGDQRRHGFDQAVTQRRRQARPIAVAAELRASQAAAGQDRAPRRQLAAGGELQGEAVLLADDPLTS